MTQNVITNMNDTYLLVKLERRQKLFEEYNYELRKASANGEKTRVIIYEHLIRKLVRELDDIRKRINN